jgi:hypothetical protein
LPMSPPQPTLYPLPPQPRPQSLYTTATVAATLLILPPLPLPLSPPLQNHKGTRSK